MKTWEEQWGNWTDFACVAVPLILFGMVVFSHCAADPLPALTTAEDDSLPDTGLCAIPSCYPDLLAPGPP